MNYEEFILSLQEELRQSFIKEKESYQFDTDTSYGINDTNNEYIRIRGEEQRPSISFLLPNLYELYMVNGQDMDIIISHITKIVREKVMTSLTKNEDDLSVLSDWNAVKKRLFCKLINRADNESYLQNKPYTNFQDLAVIYEIILERNSEGTRCITMTNHMLSSYGVSVEELHMAAVNNLARENRALIAPLWDFIEQFMTTEERSLYEEEMPTEERDYFLVLSNQECINGAAQILNPEVQEKIADKVGGDYFVLPSSVHELIIVAKLYSDMDDIELQENVKMINETCVRPEERLSDNVYEYNAKTKTLMICGAERNKEQEHPISEAERDGLELALDYGLTDDLEYTEEELQQILDQRQEIEREKKYQERSIRHGRR